MKLSITVDNRIRFDLKDIPNDVRKEIRKSFTYSNAEYFKKKNMGFKVYNLQPYISTYTVRGNEMTLPRGGIRKLKNILAENDIEFEIIDNRLENELPFNLKFCLKVDNKEIKPDKYQEKQILNAIVKQQGVLVTPTAGGKTVIMSLILEKLKQRTLVLVHTTKLLEQWIEFFQNAFGLEKEDIGIVGGGKFIIKPITVGLVQSVSKKYGKMLNDFGCIMMDECHHAPAPSFIKCVDPFSAKYKFGCTGTDYRKDKKEFLMWDVFGETVYEITDENLKEVNRIEEVKIKVVKTEFNFYKYETDGKGNVVLDEEGEPVKKFIHPSILSKKIISNPERNALIFKYFEEEYNKGHFCMLLTDRRAHAKAFKNWLKRKGIESKLFIGGKPEEGKEAIEQVRKGELRCIIGINQGSAEGINIRRLDRGFIIMPSASNKTKLVQQLGRFKRKHPDKKDAIVYYFWDYKIYPNHLKLIQKYFGKDVVEILDNYSAQNS